MDCKVISRVIRVVTKPYTDQNPGTSGLRKKVKHVQQENYLENFVQCIFLAHDPKEYSGKSLVLAGDGRYYNDIAIRKIVKICAGNLIAKVIIAENGIMSTPAVSLLVRQQPADQCFGAIILTASHNPGGEDEDFGIKFNNSAGAPANESVTSKIFEESKRIEGYYTLDTEILSNLTESRRCSILDQDSKYRDFDIVIESSTSLYVEKMRELFDFDKLKALFNRKDFKFTFDAMHGASSQYAIEIFHKIFNVDLKHLHNCSNLPDFGGIHPDPNLVHAHDLVEIMDLHGKITDDDVVPDFGAACDGDADRNMILGKRFFVSPSDSVAVIAANYKLIPNLKKKGSLVGVARSMPTSRALDKVAQAHGVKCYETPTGWKFFGNLMDAGLISICGEESFGTGSDHIREKDGIWAILCWLSILAEKNYDNKDKLIGVKDVVMEFWKTYGRDYYCRYDYENLSLDNANKIKENLINAFTTFKNMNPGNNAYVFEYHDPVDSSVSKNQGWVFSFQDGSRIIFRVSGTSSTGATIRIYFEKHVDSDGNLDNDVLSAIKAEPNLVDLALSLSNIHEVSGMTGPSVIT